MMKKGLKRFITTCMATMLVTTTVLAASESLNGGGATWSGGENDGTLYSQLRDNKDDGVRYEVKVWVQSDDGKKSEKFGTTNAVGASGQVRVTRAASHSNPFVTEKSGYNSFKAISAK